MKQLFYILIAAGILATACNSGAAKEDRQTAAAAAVTDSTQGAPEITFEQTVHNFGQITQGEKVEYAFKFTNTGNRDLLIQDAVSSCGCTVPEWPKEPVKPGESGYLKVVFDSHGKEGFTEKEISIKANTNPPFIQGPKIQCTIVKN
ncbi:DUF1573 domain-containing protein [Chitinophaga japonensis]|uniref:Uncharacterized protein DUF1573 n=1 Tax=Chitinophaga japonensis TaxID=104662 RepID=A0A562STI9_CHIJA|nr:DUF1573 domain-containing protein [Chitinophaga japonensis]TWI84344.1 uncharacterized protein DUF1573 [Chitinophaga japonensis]